MRLFAKILRFSISYGPDWSLLIYGSPITTDEDGRDEKISEQRRMLVGAFQLRPVVNGKDRLSVAGYTPTNIVGSSESMGLARFWIEECNKHHVACKRPMVDSNPDWLPTRLIHIDDENARLRLVLGNLLPSGTLYTTLSHCWGKLKDKTVLTKSLFEEWQHELPELDRWKTFADAIEISRQLGIHYIWIDSLCIIQDSPADWQDQYPQMSNVYKRSYCNIAATAALDDTEGCLHRRDITLNLPLRLNMSDFNCDLNSDADSCIPIGTEASHERGLQKLYELEERNVSWDWFSQEEAPLNTRGWVLQERHMAPRILNFLKRQMYWECDEIGASEVLPYGVESQLLQLPAKAHNPFMLRNLDHEDLNLERPRSPSFPYKLEISPTVKKALQIWGMAVRDYTARNSRNYKNLSDPADKLVAISAIMRELQPYMNCAYLAGHWKTDLICQLGWRSERCSTRLTDYRAPSWSWASVDTCVSDFIVMYDTEKIHFHPLAEIMSVNVEPLTEDAMGQVKSGELVLKGQILDLEVKEWYHSWGSLRFHGKISDQMAKLDDDASPPPTPYFIKCVPIGLSFELPRPGDEHPRWRFRSIIVEQTGTEGVYKRVGFVGAYGLTEGKDRFMSDPVLQTLGTFDWSNEGIPDFSLNTEGKQVLQII